LGLSGKSVVARTRICTEGNGTITILRTKGWEDLAVCMLLTILWVMKAPSPSTKKFSMSW
jgi:hypothetical protein